MKCYEVPLTDGKLDIDYSTMVTAIQVSDTSFAVVLTESATISPLWQPLEQEEFKILEEQVRNPENHHSINKAIKDKKPGELRLSDIIGLINNTDAHRR